MGVHGKLHFHTCRSFLTSAGGQATHSLIGGDAPAQRSVMMTQHDVTAPFIPLKHCFQVELSSGEVLPPSESARLKEVPRACAFLFPKTPLAGRQETSLSSPEHHPGSSETAAAISDL